MGILTPGELALRAADRATGAAEMKTNIVAWLRFKFGSEMGPLFIDDIESGIVERWVAEREAK